ncbi:MAG: penicillin-binding transpeptidase domain-containing protein [Actinomycetota bacterium]|nr:penicillin-binding transpeptidase domain-containing protein [Actinomycetota bacterium]
MLRRTCAALLVLVTAALSGCSDADEREQAAREAAQDYLDAWASGDLTTAAELTDNSAAALLTLRAIATSMGFGEGEQPLETEITGVDLDEVGATVSYTATWEFSAAPDWTYDVAIDLISADDGTPTIAWGNSAVHPDLADGETIEWSRGLAERAPILDAAGNPIFTPTPVVVVGVDPARVTDLETLAATLASTLGISAADIVASVSASQPGQFVPIITLRRPDYDAVRPVIFDLPGTVFREETRQLAPTAGFALGVLGRVGEATAEVLEEAGPDYAAGDQLGTSGLQRGYQEQLAGTPGLTVEAVSADGARRYLEQIEPQAGTPIQTTLDTTIQNAADAAVSNRAEPAHIVVLRPGTGEILAVSSNSAANPANALVGQYPAGSSFKIISGSALLGGGIVGLDTPVPCPGTVTVGGREFENEDQFDLGTVTFLTAFAESCNTTFTTAVQQLPAGLLERAAASFGIGAAWELPVEVFSGQLPAPADAVELAADAIGQGRVLVSPFSMAIAAATAASGSVPVPGLVADAPDAGSAPDPPSADVIAALQQAMREVVLTGTGQALADRGEVYGKTGTAEFGTEVPPQAHGWFVGFRPDPSGGIAFSVLVENGQSSGTSAVPLADAFLDNLG